MNVHSYDVIIYLACQALTLLMPECRQARLQRKAYRPHFRRSLVTTPDLSTAAIEFASGAVAHLTTNFYVGFHSKQKGIEFHGDKGSLYWSNWHDFNGTMEYTDFAALPPAGDPYKPLPYVKEPYAGKAGEPGSNVE